LLHDQLHALPTRVLLEAGVVEAAAVAARAGAGVRLPARDRDVRVPVGIRRGRREPGERDGHSQRNGQCSVAHVLPLLVRPTAFTLGASTVEVTLQHCRVHRGERTGQPTTTQDAAGTGTEPRRRGTPVSGSSENQVTSPERSCATYSTPSETVIARGQ